MSDVYYADMHCRFNRGMVEKFTELIEKIELREMVEPRDLVAIKTHFGERGNTAFVPVTYLRCLAQRVKDLRGNPFVTDANTLYVGGRSNACNHLLTAASHGFTHESLGAPVIIADGLTGQDFVEVEVDGDYFQKVKIGSAAVFADALIAVTHLTGHELTGFGGALKNVGMGLGSRGGKQQMHSDIKPEVNEENCKACANCIRWCPAGAISFKGKGKNKSASIDRDKCIGCGECTIACVEGAIAVRLMTDLKVAQSKISEYASGVLRDKAGKCAFFNFLIDISPACDCWNYSDIPPVGNIGIVASRDIVAIEQASIDLVNKEAGKDVFGELYPNADWAVQLDHAVKMGLGSRDYDLVKLD